LESTVSDEVDLDGDITMDSPLPPIPSPDPDDYTDTPQTPEPTERRLNIASICNAEDEDPEIRPYRRSELSDDDELNVVQIPC